MAGLEGIDGHAVQALLKLESSLPATLRHRVEAIQATVLTLGGPGPALDLDVLMTVAGATRDHRQITADYTTHGGTALRRTLQPHRIVRVTDRWYLIAWDLRAADWRTLRLDRLGPDLRLGPRFVPRALDDSEVLTAVSEGVTDRPYRWHAVLTAHAAVSEVGEVIGPTRSRVTAVDPTTTRITGGGDDLTAMALWILSLPFEVTLHEPAEVVPHLERLAARAARLSTSTPSAP